MDNNFQLPVGGLITTIGACVITISFNLVHYVRVLNDGLHILASCATIAAACTTICVAIHSLKKNK